MEAADAAALGRGPQLLPPPALQLIDALERSRLLPAVCRGIMDFPAPNSIPGMTPDLADLAGQSLEAAVTDVASDLGSGLHHVLTRLLRLLSGPPPGAPRPPAAPPPPSLAARHQAEVVLGLLRSGGPDLVRLQRAMLERVLVRAEGQGRAGGAQEVRPGGGGARGGGGGGRGVDGGFWAVLLDRQHDEAAADAARGDASLQLSDCAAVSSSLYLWCSSLALARAAAAGSDAASGAAPAIPDAPPPAEVAALAVRAARALCWLSRGQGRGGTYRQATWVGQESAFAVATFGGLVNMIPACMPTAEALRLLPDCLEAGAWALAWAARAAAACPLRPQPGGVDVYGARGQPLLATLLKSLHARIGGLQSLGPAARADCRARAAAAGLACTLDSVLRLAYDEAERLAAQGKQGEAALEEAPLRVGRILNAGLVPVISTVDQQGDRDAPGLLVTAAKRARLLADRLQALQQGPPPATAAAAEAEWLRARGPLCDASNLMLVIPCGILPDAVPLSARRPAAGAAGGDPDPRVACANAEHEALSLVLRSASGLLASAGHCAARLHRAPMGVSAATDLLRGIAANLTSAFLRLMYHVSAAATGAAPLPPSHLLAIQPHRLLAAACGLLPLVRDPSAAETLALGLAAALAALAAHEQLSGRVEAWMAPPVGSTHAAGAGSSTAPGAAAGRGSALRGCLRGPLLGAVPLLRRHSPIGARAVWALLRLAAGAPQAPAEGGVAGGGARPVAGGAAGAGTFRGVALRLQDGDVLRWAQVLEALPESVTVFEGQMRALGAAPGNGSTADRTELDWLPPALHVERVDVALTWLRLCGNPRCDNFGGASEWGLQPKLCSGCQSMRYCRPECQQAHWQAGHRAECRRRPAA